MKKIIYSILLLAVVSSCSKEKFDQPALTSSDSDILQRISENNNNPDDQILSDDAMMRSNSTSYVYTMSNVAGTNTILIYRQQPNGSLSAAGTVASGGNGTGMNLGSQGAVIIDKQNDLLFAVNAGSNSISSFRIGQNGNLTLLSTAPSGGEMPVSLTLHESYLYVVNAISSNISGLMVSNSGTLAAIANSSQPLSAPMAGPAQISFSPNGSFLYVTEKMTNKISLYPVDANGLAQVGTSRSSVGMTPFGFDYARDYMIVSNAHGGMMNASSATSYTGVNVGDPSAVNGEIPNNQTAACWVATTAYGRYAYITNTGSNTISSYYIADNGSLYLVNAVAAVTDAHPVDICIDNNRFVHNVNTDGQTITSYRRNVQGRLHRISAVAGIPVSATGIACY